MVLRREIHFFMPVLDGTIPAEWQVWGRTFERACFDFEDTPRPLPGSFKYVEAARLHINLQTPEELLDRTDNQWSRVAGVLVDGGGGPADRQERFERFLDLCSRLRPANAIYAKLGRFPIGFMLPSAGGFNQEAIEFADRLEREGARQLQVHAECHHITTSRGFIDVIRTLEWQLARDWMNRGRDVA